MFRQKIWDENNKGFYVPHYKIGERNTRLYTVWRAMICRCCCESYTAYRHYGGRGITVCDEWKIYENFKEWSLKNGYADELEIDRKDNNGGYSPDNCRYVTHAVNMRNKRGVVYVTIDNRTACLSEWAEAIGRNYQTVKFWKRQYGIEGLIQRIKDAL